PDSAKQYPERRSRISNRVIEQRDDSHAGAFVVLRKHLFEASCNNVHRGACRVNSHSRFQSSLSRYVMATVILRVFVGESHRSPQLSLYIWKLKRLGHDADDHVAAPVERYGLADD